MPGLLRGIARTAVIAGTASAVAGNVQHKQQERWASENQDAQQAPAPQQDDMTAQLEQLNNLKNQGLITQDDFDAKKKQILGL